MCRGPLRTQDLNETPVVSGQTPYSNDLTWTRTFTLLGAALTRVCFTGFDVENYDDTVEICDGADHIVEVLTGRKNPVGGLASFCSAWVQGDTAKVVFQTDGSVTGTGFVLRRVESRNAFTQDARFPGQWLDRDTEVKSSTTGALLYSGLHQNWHREFDPDTGRYLTPDPLGLLAGSNLFASAHNDSLHHADPDGLQPDPRTYDPFRTPSGGQVVPLPFLNPARVLRSLLLRLVQWKIKREKKRLEKEFQRELKNDSPNVWGSCEKKTKEFVDANPGFEMVISREKGHAYAVDPKTGLHVDRIIGTFLRSVRGRTRFTPTEHRRLMDQVPLDKIKDAVITKKHVDPFANQSPIDKGKP